MYDTGATSKHIRRNLAIVTALLILLVGPNFGPIPAYLGETLDIEQAVIALLASFLIGFTIIIAIILRLTKMSLKDFLAYVGLGAPSRWTANLAGLILGLAWGALFLSSILQFEPDTDITQITALRVLAALLAASGALLEDVVTRGYLMNRLNDRGVAVWIQVVLSAVLFAIYHTIWGFNIFSFIFSIVYGLMLGGLFVWGKRSLTPVILGHSLAVLISEPFSSMLIFIAPTM